MQPFPYPAPVGKLRAPVAGDGLDQLGREGRQGGDYGVLHGLCPAVRHLHRYVKPRLSLCQGRKAGFALALAAHHRVRFPMSGLLAAVHRLVPLADGLSPAVLTPRLFHSVALSLSAQHLQIAVYQVFLIDPAIYCASAGQLQLTRGTGNLLRRPRHRSLSSM